MSSAGKSGDSQNYQENYFDIEDILATQQRIPCQFEQQVYNLGRIFWLQSSIGLRQIAIVVAVFVIAGSQDSHSNWKMGRHDREETDPLWNAQVAASQNG